MFANQINMLRRSAAPSRSTLCTSKSARLIAMYAVNRQQKLAVFYRRKSASYNIGGASMRPDKETPQPGRAWGVKGGIESNLHGANYATRASIWPAQWWGRQACTCYGEGHCLCCRRFDRAIRSHQARVAAGGK